MKASPPVLGSLLLVLLDTTIAVAALPREAAFCSNERVQTVLPATAIGELYHGAHRAALTAKEIGNIRTFMANSIVVDTDPITAEHYGIVKYLLQRQGTPIPENDVWIAASALQRWLPLATRDGHFRYVP